MAEIRSLLDEVIEAELQNLTSVTFGSAEETTAIRNLAALHKLRIDEMKAQTEADEKRERRMMDSEQRRTELALKEREQAVKDADRTREEAFQRQQVRDQAIDRYVKIGISAAELVLPLMFYGVWMKKGFRFEETGTYTSATFRNLFNRFKPTRKS